MFRWGPEIRWEPDGSLAEALLQAWVTNRIAGKAGTRAYTSALSASGNGDGHFRVSLGGGASKDAVRLIAPVGVLDIERFRRVVVYHGLRAVMGSSATVRTRTGNESFVAAGARYPEDGRPEQ